VNTIRNEANNAKREPDFLVLSCACCLGLLGVSGRIALRTRRSGVRIPRGAPLICAHFSANPAIYATVNLSFQSQSEFQPAASLTSIHANGRSQTQLALGLASSKFHSPRLRCRLSHWSGYRNSGWSSGCRTWLDEYGARPAFTSRSFLWLENQIFTCYQ
jgi:hypothetical protein